MSKILKIQPAVITTFALSDLMALFTQKCHAPPAVVESSMLIDIVNPYNSATFVENRLLQTVPKRKDSMNTLMSGMGVPCTGTLRASVLSDS